MPFCLRMLEFKCFGVHLTSECGWGGRGPGRSCTGYRDMQTSLQTYQPSWTGAESQFVKRSLDETTVNQLLQPWNIRTGRLVLHVFLIKPIPLVIGGRLFWS